MASATEQPYEDQRQILELVALGKPLSETLEAVARFVERHEPGSRCAILIASADRRRVATCVAPSFSAAFHDALSGISIDTPHLGLCGAVADRGEVMVANDVSRTEKYSKPWRELLLACGSQAVSSHPIYDGDDVVACLSVHYAQPQTVLPKNTALIEGATHLASVAIHRNIASEASERRSRRAFLLSSISQRLVVNDDPTPDLKPAFDAICAEVGADLYFSYSVDKSDPELLTLQHHRGLTDAQQRKFSSFRFGEHLCGKVAATQQSIILGDLDMDSSASTEGVREIGGRCYAGFPLVARGRLYGTVAFVSSSKASFTKESASLIEAVATQFAAAIDRSVLFGAKAVSEQRLALITDAMPSLMAVVGSDGRYEYVNASYERWFNIPAEEAVGKTVAEILGEKAWATVRDRMHQAMNGQRVRFETDIHYDRAGFRHIRAEYIPRPNENGTVEGCYVLVHDLTDRKRHEEAVARNERILGELVQNAPFGVYIVDADLRIVQMNAESQSGSFRNVKPVVGRNLGDAMRILWPVPVAEKVVARFQHTLETGIAYRSRDFIERRNDVRAVESYEWELHRIILPDGQFGVVCYYFDSTPIRRAEGLARESEQRFRHMADNAPVMIWMTELDGTCSYLSKPWYEFTGQSEEQGLGMGWLDAVHPEDRITSKQTFIAANKEREPFRLEYRLRRHDGEYLWCIDAAAPRFQSDGQFLGYIGSVIEISDRKRAEETQKLLLSELNHRVKNTLANVQAIAQQTLRRTRDPAQFVESFTGRLQALSKAHSMLSQTTWQGADLEALLRDQLSMGPVDLRTVQFAGPAITIAPQLALHLALMVHELATNAIKYGALSSAAGRVLISWTATSSDLAIQWAESGGSTVASSGTRGFGTTLIEHGAKSLGGHAVMLHEDGGIVWQLRLPLHRVTTQFYSSSPAPVRSTRPSQEALQGLRVLVIEDEPLVAMEIAAIIHDAGAEPIGPVSSCSAALDRIRIGGFDLSVLDGNLLGEPVDELAAALTRSKVPFLFISGYGRESLPRAYSHAPLIGKPFASDALIDGLVKLTTAPVSLSIVDQPNR